MACMSGVLSVVVSIGPQCCVKGLGDGASGNRMAGRNFRKNFLLRRVTLRDPSMRTTYWSNCFTSITEPVLSHLRGWGPTWFCTQTLSPTDRGTRVLVPWSSLSAHLRCLWRRASSRLERVSRQVGCGIYFPGWIGIKSRMGRPNIHWAGETWVSRSGVFRYCRMALRNLSVFSEPSGEELFVRRRLTVFTPVSALQLLCGNAIEDNRL